MSYAPRPVRVPGAGRAPATAPSLADSSIDPVEGAFRQKQRITDSAFSERQAPGLSDTSEVWIEAEALRSDFRRFVRRRLHNASAVEDVLQDFYVRVFENAHLLKEERSVRPWLYRLLRSSLIDCARSDLRQRAIAVRLSSYAPSFVDDTPIFDSICAEMLEELKPEYSDILVRMRLRGDTAEEAAADLGTTPNNIRVRHFRARAALRSVYARDNPAARFRKPCLMPSFATATA